MPLQLHQSHSTKIIGIAAGKGGVGKSTLTALLGLHLKSLNYRVGILDCDLYGPSLRKILPEDRMPSKREGKFIPALSFGIPILSIDHFDKISASVRAPIANHWINQLLYEVQWGPLDFLLIDFPPGTGDIPLTLCEKGGLHGAILISTPQQVALQDVCRALSLFRQVKIPILGIIENMSYFATENSQEKIYPFGHGTVQTFAQNFNIPLLGEIPLDPAISIGADQGFNRLTQPHKLWGPDSYIEKIVSNLGVHVSRA